MQYFVFLYKRMLNSQAIEAAGIAAAIAAADSSFDLPPTLE